MKKLLLVCSTLFVLSCASKSADVSTSDLAIISGGYEKFNSNLIEVGEESVQQTRHTVDEMRGGKGGDGGDGVLGEESAHPLPAGEDSRGGVEDEEAGGNGAAGATGGEEAEWR